MTPTYHLDIAAIVIALLALHLSIRHHYISVIYAQIAARASECNSHINPQYPKILESNVTTFSAVYSGIVVMQQLIDAELSDFKSRLFCIHKPHLIHVFHLQLHTKIRADLKSNDKTIEDRLSGWKRRSVIDQLQQETLKQQFATCYEFLKAEIQKDQTSASVIADRSNPS